MGNGCVLFLRKYRKIKKKMRETERERVKKGKSLREISKGKYEREEERD